MVDFITVYGDRIKSFWEFDWEEEAKEWAEEMLESWPHFLVSWKIRDEIGLKSESTVK